MDAFILELHNLGRLHVINLDTDETRIFMRSVAHLVLGLTSATLIRHSIVGTIIWF